MARARTVKTGRGESIQLKVGDQVKCCGSFDEGLVFTVTAMGSRGFECKDQNDQKHQKDYLDIYSKL